ncbi:hypothetical protein FLL45_18235 [Aliikangiella marina]|uniref:Lipoprotein n=1 Tax=Aliikangiella marina TaxID=1712262 RepID=A0A545T4K9_9GAMM|nr:hypothetical protein [Aliikangiella marina]TQV72160.1 hypothetical protein FLL45_18235 [Aliikangiella marina]
MKFTRLLSVGAVAGVFALTGCGGGDITIQEGDEVVQPPVVQPPVGFQCPSFATQLTAIGSFDNVCELSGTLTANATLSNDALWVLNGRVAVGEDRANSATLSIEAGTTIMGRSGDDFLVVRRDSQINAAGTAAAPITMTSFEDVTGAQTGIGQWGGLVLLGNAPANLCDGDGDNVADATELANCSINAEGDAGLYGGDNPNDDSGTLRYVVVKHAGNALGSGDELNGITFAGVGDATEVDFIQVHENLDDGVEFFGGTVNVKHVVLTGNGDDSFDWAFGWSGRAQYVYIQHNDVFANRGFESDNSEDFPTATPLTDPMVSNVTIVGGNVPDEDSEGVLLRHGTAGRLHNFVITGPAGMGECLEVDSFPETRANAASGALIMTNSVVACDNGENFKGNATDTLTTEEWFLGQSGNLAFDGSAALNLDLNGYVPLVGSPLLGAGIDASTVDAWFDSTDYIGAFDGTNNWMEGWTVGVRGGFPADVQNALQQGLATNASAEYPEITDKPVYKLATDTTFTADVTLTNDAHWVLKGRTAVGNDNADNTTLYIEAGTTIFGETGDDFLVARRGSKIEAVGTVGAPIVMTSVQDVTGQETGIGQWGGLVLLGNAPVNLCDGNGDDLADATELANCGINAEGDAGLYGGDDPTDNSGTLKFVIVKHAGNSLGSGDELNGISFAGVGSGTTVDYIQVHENLDDGVEFFGGTVDVRHVVLTGNGDDSFDWAFGWTGRAQFVYVQHNDTAANRGFESDNSEDFPGAAPLTSPTVANVTVRGNNAPSEDSEGVLLRHGTAGILRNFVITGPAGMGECLEIDSFPETRANAEDGSLIMTHSVVACENGENFKGTANTSGDTVEDWFLAQTGNSAFDNAEALQMLADGFTPKSGSPLLGAGYDLSADDDWFKATDYIGAFDGNTNWMDGWAFGIDTGIPSNVTAADAQGLATDASATYPAITDKPVYLLNTDVVFTTDVVLTNDKHWIMKGRTAVGNDNADNTTLYIEPGTTLIGETGDDFLVARRGSKIEALGSASSPIIMTSIQDMTGQATGIGQWGGLVLLGNAPVNLCDGNGDDVADATELANCGINAEGDAGLYGGDDPADNSGTLRYVVVKHAGNALGSGDELNGISFAGVGNGTTVDYIQVHENLDDGVEFFGGTVDVRHLVLTANGDDSFDWAFGWTGRAQYVLIKHDAAFANRGIEGDNSEDFPAATPMTKPTVANFTIIGAANTDSEGVLLRHGTSGDLYNFIITGPAGMGECLEIDSFAETQANAEAGELTMINSVVACENGENFKGTANTSGDTVEAWFLAQTGNAVEATQADAVTGYVTNTANAAADMNAVDSWFDTTDFVGAVGSDNDWTAGWVTVGLE